VTSHNLLGKFLPYQFASFVLSLIHTSRLQCQGPSSFSLIIYLFIYVFSQVASSLEDSFVVSIGGVWRDQKWAGINHFEV
jgi:hypothetical protein